VLIRHHMNICFNICIHRPGVVSAAKSHNGSLISRMCRFANESPPDHPCPGPQENSASPYSPYVRL
jgi:hypothetical protein